MPLFRNPPWHEVGSPILTLTEREWDWSHRQFRLPDVWKRFRGAGIRVAVLDTGYFDHKDLTNQVIKAQNFTNSRTHLDRQGHSTHCCGIIAAREDDSGIMGVAPDLAKDGGGLLVGKVLGDDGSGDGAWIAAGIEWAANNGSHVISMSLGSPDKDPRIVAAVRSVVNAGITVVCAAGNDGRPNSVNWPGRMEEVIAVAAVEQGGGLAPYSSRGPQVDIAAPGSNILSTYLKNQYMRLSGTSMATPFVSAAIALLMSSDRSRRWTPKEIRKALIDNAQDAGKPGQDDGFGFGLLRPDKLPFPKEPPGGVDPVDPDNPGGGGGGGGNPGGGCPAGDGTEAETQLVKAGNRGGISWLSNRGRKGLYFFIR